jgi:hypothetical protein
MASSPFRVWQSGDRKVSRPRYVRRRTSLLSNPVPGVLTGNAASFRSSSRRMSSSASCAISALGLWQEGCGYIRHRPAGETTLDPLLDLFSGSSPRRQLFRVAGRARNPEKSVLEFRAHFCHSAVMVTYPLGASDSGPNAAEGEKQFLISLSVFLSVQLDRRVNDARA